MHPGRTVGSVNVLDGGGSPLGALDQNQLVTVSAAPGTHAFYANMGGAQFATDRNMNDLLQVTVEAGRTYYVTATTNPVALRAVVPTSRDNRWAERRGWVSGCQPVTFSGLTPAVQTYFGDTSVIMATARQRFDDYDAAHRAEHVAAASEGE